MRSNNYKIIVLITLLSLFLGVLPVTAQDRETEFVLTVENRITQDDIAVALTPEATLEVDKIEATVPSSSEACAQDYVVQANDWLSKIADKFLGDMLAYDLIFEATNTAAKTDSKYTVIADPDIIEIGQVLCIPGAARAERVVIFDSGRGVGQYDHITYFEYTSEISFTPQADMTIRSIKPEIYYCNGSCGYRVFIRDDSYQPLASQAGLLDANDQLSPPLPDWQLDSQVYLKAGTTYLIIIEVWTTKSIGIYTTGNRTTGVTGAGIYVINYAKSDTADHIDRGGVSFQLLY